AVLADLAERVPRVAGDERGGSAWTSFLREVAVARRWSDRTAANEVARSLQLVRMPIAFSLLAAGDLPVAQMRALVEESYAAGAAALARIDAEVAMRATRLPPSRVRDAVRKVLLREEADAAAVRAAKATALRQARRTSLTDDQAEISLCGPAVVIAQTWDALDRQARALRASGDARTLDALRFDLAIARLEQGAASSCGGRPTWARAGSPDSLGHTGPGAPPAATGDAAWLTDRRCSRPVRLNITVPVTTALGLSNEPGWLDGHGWVSAPTVRQLLPAAELRQLCADAETGRLVDLAEQVVRPERTPQAVAEALRRMASVPFEVTDTSWQAEGQHDPSDRLRELVVLRDQLCDGPTTRTSARRAELDHERPYPDGPTAAWNVVARGARTHQLKHRGWRPRRTADGTVWTSPAGQVVTTPRATELLRPLEPDAVLPDPDVLAAIETELLRPPTRDDDPPDW
ncbi:MAG: endonuclease, partial [Frankiales bacterium]|nr:endonuclease [Frankiales bacterium]